MRIQNNIMALNAHRQLGNNTNKVSKSLEKLSSGFRINRAGDDAAGLAISEKMRSQIKGLETAQANSQDGISLVQTAEGALTEVHSMLNRMVELATKSSNGTYMDDDRVKIQKEVDSLNEEIDRISQSVNFNKQNLLDGTLGGGSATVGAEAAITTGLGTAAGGTIAISGVEKGTKVTIDAGTAAGVSVSTGGTITVALKAGDALTQANIDKVLKDNSKVLPKGLKISISGVKEGTKVAKATATGIALAAADPKKASKTSGGYTFTAKTAGGVNGKIAVAAAAGGAEGATVDAAGNTSLSLDSNKTYTKEDINKLLAKAGSDIELTEWDGTVDTFASSALGSGAGAGNVAGAGLVLQVGDTADTYQKMTVAVGDMGAGALGIKGIDVSKQDAASASIKKMNDAINTVSQTRADLGAIQNRLDHTISNLGVTTENLKSAESRIRDADMASEMMTFTKDNVLTQAAQAMLAQANQQPQSVLQLLQ